MGVFIQITVDETKISLEVGQALVSLCPVDIFAWKQGRLLVRPEQDDECTLCELCLTAAPAGALVIRKRYKKDEQLVSRGESHSH
ncbi:MAG: hypothetical protein U0401_24080 [Anaerolineae bacterium]